MSVGIPMLWMVKAQVDQLSTWTLWSCSLGFSFSPTLYADMLNVVIISLMLLENGFLRNRVPTLN